MCSAPVDEIDNPRVALVGAASLLGKEIKQQLADTGVPGTAVSLLDFEEVAGVITEYGDEARVLAEAVAEKILEHDVACFCGNPDAALEQREDLRRAGRVGIDCTGAWATADDAFLWIPGVSSPPHLDECPALALPSTPTILLGMLLDALGDTARQAVVTLLLPASEHGEAGLQELSQQTIAVLNLEEVERDVFERQLAFDLWPASHHGSTADTLITDEIQRLGLETPALSVVSASVFHGLAASVYLPHSEPDAVIAALGEADVHLESDDADAVDSPVRAAGHPGIHASSVRADAGGGTWVWVVADNLVIRAHAAVAAVHALLGPQISAAPQ